MDREDYKVAIVCALPCEVEACRLSLDQVHDALRLSPNSTRKNYILGSIGSQNVVIASLPHGNYGPLSAATVSAQLEYDFTSIESRLLVGVAGGVPDLNRSSPQDIRLGDVVVSTPTKKSPGVVTHDSGTIVQAPQGQVFQRTGTSNQPPQNLLMIVTTLRGSQAALQQSMAAHINQIREVSEDFRNIPRPDEMQDNLIDSGYIHKDSGSRCDKDCERHRIHRDERKRTSHMSSTVQRSCGALCFDMEAGGVMNNRQYLIIRGIADYADSHKNKDWQPYAAATAAAYAKELILAMAPSAQQKTQGGAQEPPTPAAPTIHGAQNQNNYGGQNLTGSFKHVSFGVMGTQAHPPVAQPPQPLFPCASCRTELPWESPIVWCTFHHRCFCQICKNNNRIPRTQDCSLRWLTLHERQHEDTRFCGAHQLEVHRNFQGVRCARRSCENAICSDCLKNVDGRRSLARCSHDRVYWAWYGEMGVLRYAWNIV